MKKLLILYVIFLTSTTFINAGVLDAALNATSTPLTNPHGGQTVRTSTTGIDPDNPEIARSTYNAAMDFGASQAINPSSWNSMSKGYESGTALW